MTVRGDIDPRIERSRAHILAATIDLLREVGYGALTIEAVAARSGVAKSTIYRHWPGKSQLAADAFLHAYESKQAPPPGPVRDRVVAYLCELAGTVVAPERELACLLPALIDAAERSEEIAALAGRLAELSAAPLIAVLDEAVEAGELPAGTDTRALADALAGPVLLRRLLHRPCVCPDEIPALVDQILPTP
ncbi:MAG TPA: TetR/AcrR family transcriptional regulator [Acidimicrobiales bacterium]